MSVKDTPKLRSSLTEFLGSPEIFNQYEKLDNHADRVEFIFNCQMVQTLFKNQSKVVKNEEAFSKYVKNNRESTRLRELGNKAFKEGRDSAAVDLYSKAVIQADRNVDSFVLALANRSAAQTRLGSRFWLEKALADLDLVLELNQHPNPGKLLERKALCHEKLNQPRKVLKLTIITQ